MAGRLEHTIEISAPVSFTFRRATSFESYPDFLPGLHAVRRLRPDRLCFVAVIGGGEHAWEAEIAEQVRNRSLTIASSDRLEVAGVLSFARSGRSTTQLRAVVDYASDPLRERLIEMMVNPQRKLEGGLERFRETVEQAHAEHRARASAKTAATGESR